MSEVTYKERLNQNNEKLEGIKNKVDNLPEYQDTSDATALEKDILSGKTAYVNNKLIDGKLVLDGNVQTSKYSGGMLQSCFLTIPELDTSNATSMRNMFNRCSSLTTIPELNTSNTTNMLRMFYKCTSLTNIPPLDTSNVTNMQDMFRDCSSLSDESLNNILAMCTNAVKITNLSYKTLRYIGLDSNQASKCKTLSNYQAFLDARWRTGY